MTVNETNGDKQLAFREAMRNVPAAVSVITTLADGQPYGTTVSAFTSLSMDPPMLLISLDKKSTLLSKLREGSIVGVNVLASHQESVALHFARKSDDKFDGVRWDIEDGAPGLPDRHAWVAMRVACLIEVADHVLALGHVEAADARPGAPLTYWQRTFGTHKA